MHDLQALRRISLSIERGEFIALIGANGSGKSTLARLMNALLLPTSGEVSVCGMDTALADNHRAIREKVGMVFQNPDSQIIATVVEEDVAFGLENIGVGSEEMQERVDQALRAVQMEEYLHHAPHLLSGGQKQRVAIAGVIAMKPQLIIFDEATAMLDPEGRTAVLDCIRDLNRQGIGIVLITQHVTEALGADRVLVLDEGSLVASGTPHQVLTDVELLHRYHLLAAPVAELAWMLCQRGYLKDYRLLKAVELAEEICRLA